MTRFLSTASAVLFAWTATSLPAAAEEKKPAKPRVAEIQSVVEAAPERSVEEGPSDESPELTKGYPDYALQHVEEVLSARGVDLEGEKALEVVRTEVRSQISDLEDLESYGGDTQEAIIIVDIELRPALLICNSQINDPVPPRWFEKLNACRDDLSRGLRSVGLVAVTGLPGSGPKGTAFVVAPNIVMTNRHVAEEFAVRNGAGFEIERHPASGMPGTVTVDFGGDLCSSVARHKVVQVLHIEPKPGPDVAVLRIDGETPDPLPLQQDAPAFELPSREIVTMGFPFADPRNPYSARLQIFGTQYGVKRLAPGELKDGSGQAGGEGTEPLLLHDCSTLGGNSGSPVFDLETQQVVGLHFGGSYEEQNLAWPMWRVLQIPAVQDAIDQ